MVRFKSEHQDLIVSALERNYLLFVGEKGKGDGGNEGGEGEGGKTKIWSLLMV